MLPREQRGVVDSHLRVHGPASLRVVDASVYPLEPLSHLQSTVYSLAEKAADLIKAGWTRSLSGDGCLAVSTGEFQIPTVTGDHDLHRDASKNDKY